MRQVQKQEQPLNPSHRSQLHPPSNLIAFFEGKRLSGSDSPVLGMLEEEVEAVEASLTLSVKTSTPHSFFQRTGMG